MYALSSLSATIILLKPRVIVDNEIIKYNNGSFNSYLCTGRNRRVLFRHHQSG